LIMAPDDFKILCMQVSTDKGTEIRNYYLSLEKLFKHYISYQYHCQIYCAKKEKQFEQHKAIQLQQEKQFEQHKTIQLQQEKEECKIKINKQNKTIKEQSKLLENSALLIKNLKQYKKKLKNKEETIYINSTKLYAKKGIFKVGRTSIPIEKKNSKS